MFFSLILNNMVLFIISNNDQPIDDLIKNDYVNNHNTIIDISNMWGIISYWSNCCNDNILEINSYI